MAAAAGSEEKATVREVYKLVDDTRKELGTQINAVREDLVGKVDGLADSISEIKDGLLPRVASLEVQRAGDRADIDGLRVDVDGLKSAHDRALGHLTAWKVAGGVFTGAAAIVVADVIAKALGA